MIVRIKGTDELEELAIVEFQGEILGNTLGELGTLQIKGTQVDMTLGQHTLVGKVVDLKNPFLVVEKKPKVTEDSTEDSVMQVDDDDVVESRMACHGVVRKKILFATRPTPIRMTKK